MKPATLTELRAAWLACKQAEKTAAAQRLEVEQQILALMPAQDEGTVTDKEAGVSVTYGVTRSVDTDDLLKHWQSLSAAAQTAIKFKASVDVRAWRVIEQHDPAARAALGQFITSKPAKPTISIKE